MYHLIINSKMKPLSFFLQRFLLPAVVFTLLFSGCERDLSCNCEQPLNLKLDFSLDIYQDTVITHFAAEPVVYNMRFIVDVYPDNVADPTLTDRLNRIIYTTAVPAAGPQEVTMQIPMPTQKVKLLIWADFVAAGTQSDLYYNTTDLTAVLVQNPYDNGLFRKEVYNAVAMIDPSRLSEGTTSIAVALESPLARYKIVSHDVRKYHENLANPRVELLATKASYLLWLPVGYNVLTQEINAFRESIVYTEPVTDITADSVTVASDYVFVSKNSVGSLRSSDGVVYDSEAYLNLEFARASDNLFVNRINSVYVPLKRGWMTIVNGDFFTNKNAGVGIDDNFGGEIVIILPD